LSILKTVKVKLVKGGNACIINESDFNPELHTKVAGTSVKSAPAPSIDERKRAAANAAGKADAEAKAKAEAAKKKG
jgi:hypothetical protein